MTLEISNTVMFLPNTKEVLDLIRESYFKVKYAVLIYDLKKLKLGQQNKKINWSQSMSTY